MAFSALAPDMTQLMVWRFITGAGVGALVSVAYPLSVEYSNIQSRPITLALMVISFPLGSAVCGLIASELIAVFGWRAAFIPGVVLPPLVIRSEEHTSELQSLMRISYAGFCLNKKNQ